MVPGLGKGLENWKIVNIPAVSAQPGETNHLWVPLIQCSMESL